MSTIHEQLQAHPQDAAGAYEANFFPREIAAHQDALRHLLTLWDALRLAQAEGITEVTMRSRTSTVMLTVPKIIGATMGLNLYEYLGNEASTVARTIERLHEELAREGESAERLTLLTLLLTPVGPDGHAQVADSQPLSAPYLPASLTSHHPQCSAA